MTALFPLCDVWHTDVHKFHANKKKFQKLQSEICKGWKLKNVPFCLWLYQLWITFLETFMTSNHNPSQSPVSKVFKIGCNTSVGQNRADILQIKDRYWNHWKKEKCLWCQFWLFPFPIIHIRIGLSQNCFDLQSCYTPF